MSHQDAAHCQPHPRPVTLDPALSPPPSQGAPETVTVESDGMTVAALDWGGDGVPLLLLHPNGFCAGLFDPLARRLAASGAFRPVGVDLRGHGGSAKPPETEAYDYEAMAPDVAAVLDSLGLDEVVALGESLGGGVAVFLDRLQPGRIRRLMLCEGIARPVTDFPPEGWQHPLAIGARRRRVVWPSRDEMVASYGSRPPLNQLAPEALRAYVEWGTFVRPDGRVELACPPEIEATIFEAAIKLGSADRAWRHLPHLVAETVVLCGDRSDLGQDRFREQAEQARASFVLVPGGHFFLQEDTLRAERLVMEHLASL